MGCLSAEKIFQFGATDFLQGKAQKTKDFFFVVPQKSVSHEGLRKISSEKQKSAKLSKRALKVVYELPLKWRMVVTIGM